jgi:hypothetical protein
MSNEKRTHQNQANRMAARKKFLDAFFDVEPSEWQLERFAEHGVEWPPAPRGRPAKSD